MSIQNFKDYLSENGLVELLGNDNPFLKNVEGKELPFLFAFKPDSYRPETGKDYYGRVQYSRNPDPILVEKERATLEVKLNAVLANHAIDQIKRWENHSGKDDFNRNVGLLSTLFTKIKKQFGDKVSILVELEYEGYGNNHGRKEIKNYITSGGNWIVERNKRYQFDNLFQKFLLSKNTDLLERTPLSIEKSIRISVADKALSKHPKSLNWDFNRYWPVQYKRENGHHPLHTLSWLRTTLRNYIDEDYHFNKRDLYSKYAQAKAHFEKFNKKHTQDIVTIANYVLNKELVAEGERLKQAIPELHSQWENFPDTRKEQYQQISEGTHKWLNELEAKVQKKYNKKVSSINSFKQNLDDLQVPENFIDYDQIKQEILEERAEIKRLREEEAARIAEEKRKEEERLREEARLKREKELKEDMENYLLMLRGSGHGHGHKGRDGKEKIWYETEEEAVAAALRMAKQKNQLHKPYPLTLRTPMGQKVHGWFTTSVVKKKAA